MPHPDTLLLSPTPQRPFTERLLIVLALLALLVLFLYFGQTVLVPLVASVLFSFLLLPMTCRLEDRGWSRLWASLVTVLLSLLLVLALAAFIGTQAASFGEQMPRLQEKLDARWHDLQVWIQNTFGVSAQAQVVWFRQQLQGLRQNAGGVVLGVFSTTGNVLIALALIPLYVFFLLYYRGKFDRFLHLLVPSEKHRLLDQITTRVTRVTVKYLMGLLVDIAILSVLFSIGYGLLGLPSFILLAVLAAVLNIIPYIGAFIGGLLPVLMAIVTKDSIWYAVGAFAINTGVQFIDNNLIMPMVVGRSVNLNPFATIIILFLGGMIWGLAGMILFIPLAGMFKIMCDEIPTLRPWGYLMGQDDTQENGPLEATRQAAERAGHQEPNPDAARDDV